MEGFVGAYGHSGHVRPASLANPALAKSALNIVTVTSLAEFHALQHEWNTLFERSACGIQFFQNFDWLAHWVEHYLAPNAGFTLHIVVGRCGNRTVMIWPLIRRQRMGLCTLSFMGAPASQYGDILVENHPDRVKWLTEAWKHIVATPDVDAVVLRNVRADANTAVVMDAARIQNCQVQYAPYIVLADYLSPDDFAARLSAKARRERRRQRKAVASVGEVDFRILSGGSEAQSAVAEAFRFKRAWLDSRNITSASLSDRRLQHFLSSIAGSRDADAGCRVSVLRVGGETAAVEIGFRCAGRHIAHIGAFNPAFERMGAGTLQCEDTIARCIDEGLSEYDLLAPADPYKLTLTKRAVELRSHAHGMTLAGKLYAELLRNGLRQFAKQSFRAMPSRLRRAVTPFLGSGFMATNEANLLLTLI